MPSETEGIRLAIILGTFLVLFFALSIVFLLSMFNKKNQLHFKEKQLIQEQFEKTILQSRIEIQEYTFNSISEEIHDNVGQILSLVKVQLNIVDQTDPVDKTLLFDAKENISKAMTDLRDIAKGLSSERIRVLGLTDSVLQETQRINRSGIMQIRFDVEGQEQGMDGQKQLIIFRIIQECLQNILKHSAAVQASILFTYYLDHLQIRIIDNGKGFNFHQEHLASQGLGLQHIFKRIDLIGGTVDINSVLQQGTTIHLTISYA